MHPSSAFARWYAAAAQDQAGFKIAADAFHPVQKIIGGARVQKVVCCKFRGGAIPATGQQAPVKQDRRSVFGLRGGFG